MAEIADFGEKKVVLVSINESVDRIIQKCPFKGKESLIECVQKYWPVTPEKANQADIVVGVYYNIIKVVATIDPEKPWKRVWQYMNEGYFKDDEEIVENLKSNNEKRLDLINRCAFFPKKIAIDKMLIGKELNEKSPLICDEFLEGSPYIGKTLSKKDKLYGPSRYINI